MIDGVNEENPNKFAMMQIDTNSMVTGVAYSGQYSEIKGTLDGISMTERYWYYRFPTTYLNWLTDAVIDRTRLDFLPVLPIILPDKNGYAIFKTFEEPS